MFGYVKAYKPEMKIAEFETYKAVYCSLCKVLGKQYGIMAKMTLSYDFTFMALLRLSVADECCGYSTMRCAFNPLKKCSCLKNHSEEMDYTAACSIILFYYKLKDNIIDSGFLGKLKSYALLPFFSRYRKKAIKKYPDIDVHAAKMILDQRNLEDGRCGKFDLAAEPTANFLKAAFVRETDSDINKRVLAQLGYCAGKWIYLMDALDDLDDDIKSGDYNVIAIKNGLYGNADDESRKQAKEYAKGVINSYNSGVCDAYVLLDKKRYDTILGNILYLGMPDVLKNLGVKQSKASESLPERTGS